MRILVTGATGFIGGHLVRRWEHEHEVYALFRHADSIPTPTAARWIQQDLEQALNQSQFPRRIDIVVHMAFLGRSQPGVDDHRLFAINAAACATLTRYAAAAGATTFVYGSSGGIYGFRRRAATESLTPRPFDLYTLSKRHGEEIVTFRAAWHPVIVRYFFPYGPGQTNGLVPRLTGAIARREPVTVYNRRGNPWFNPVYITDACELTHRAAMSGRALTLNCAGGERVNVRQLAGLIGRELAMAPVFRRERNPSIGDMMGSIRKGRTALGWQPQVELEHGMRATLRGIQATHSHD